MCEHETFLSLLRDPAHWAFELFLIALFDGLIGLLIWPFLCVHFKKHSKKECVTPSVEEAPRDTRDDTEQTCVRRVRRRDDSLQGRACGQTFNEHDWDRCVVFKGQDGIVRDMTDAAPARVSRR